MNSESCFRNEGYQKGYADGKITGGDIQKKFIEKLLDVATQDLSNKESFEYKTGWQDGFLDAIRVVIKMIMRGGFIEKLTG